jgi:hypothetical protein
MWFFSNYRTARDGKAEPRYAVAARGNDRKMRRLRRQRERISTMLGVQPSQPGVLELSGISLVSL